jgi:hypothetical protein
MFKMKKRILAMVIVTCCVFTTDLNAHAASSKIGENIDLQKFKAIQEEYSDQKEFLEMKDEYGSEYANDFLMDVYNARFGESPKILRGGGGNECYQFVKNIKQSKKYNCGSAAVLQTLYGRGKASSVSGSSDSAKMQTLDTLYDVDKDRSMYVYRAVNALNKYSGASYVYEEGSKMTKGQFEDRIANSLMQWKPVVLHAKTGRLSYYKNKDVGHYISLDYVNRTTQTVRLADPNYDNSYFGIHYVPLKEAYESISCNSVRYLIR